MIYGRCLLDSKRPHSLPREICTLYNDFCSYGTFGAGGIRAGVLFLLVDGNGVGPASAFKHHRVASEVIAVHVQPCGLFRLNFFWTSGLDSPDLDALGGCNVQIGQLRCRRRPG